MSDALLSIPCTTITGEQKTLADFDGKALLVVNTASKCGFTPQYKGLEALWQRYRDKGLVVLGFPCNQFGKQEPGNEEAISEFCELNYGVTFPLFKKIEVNGENAHPLFERLKEAAPGLLGHLRDRGGGAVEVDRRDRGLEQFETALLAVLVPAGRAAVIAG